MTVKDESEHSLTNPSEVVSQRVSDSSSETSLKDKESLRSKLESSSLGIDNSTVNSDSVSCNSRESAKFKFESHEKAAPAFVN